MILGVQNNSLVGLLFGIWSNVKKLILVSKIVAIFLKA
jgi:hypothetical protein